MVRRSLIVCRSKRVCLQRGTYKNKNNNQGFRSGFAGPVFVVVVAVVLAGLLYLLTVNARAMQGNDFSVAQERLLQLEKDHAALRIETAELTSLYAIEGSHEKLSMVSVTEVAHLDKEVEKERAEANEKNKEKKEDIEKKNDEDIEEEQKDAEQQQEEVLVLR